mgnify:CR=1 FL=1
MLLINDHKNKAFYLVKKHDEKIQKIKKVK